MNATRTWQCGAFLLVAALAAGPVIANPEDSAELKVKAAYLFNFTRFTEWPQLAQGAGAPVRICVVGSDSMGKLLAELTPRDVNGHPLEIETAPGSGRKTGHCQVLFIDRSFESRFGSLAEQLPKQDVLTVSDIPQFAQRGGVIGFVSDGGRIRLEINLRRAREARLSLSAKLLEVARIVD